MTTLIDRARTLAAELPTHTAAHERELRLAAPVVDALRAGGFLELLLPRALGGAELHPADYVAVLEALAAGDAATAWCVMTASTSTLAAPYLEREVARAIWPAPGRFLAGVFAPGGKLTADGDGFRLTGRWPFASGCRHADWFALGALREVGGALRHTVAFVPAGAVTIADNWDTLGLPGSGSHDAVVEAAALAPSHLAVMLGGRPTIETPLYRFPVFGLLALGIAGVALGVARGALDQLASRLRPAPGAEPPPSPALVGYARLTGRLAAARAHIDDVARRAYERAEAGAIDPRTRGELRVAACLTAETCAELGRAAFHLGGGASIRTGSPLGRALRDLETILSHRMVADRVLPAAARAQLGIGEPPPDL